ncbi:DUF1016 N-terminal domain-containing protein [Wolbachia endosymbiont of Ctenocephalides felis wCfeJ]|uniref:DUF1016 N-terminal domain-containing protein n=1 Tax=Wolbachia endosymbiont of Ctenocephalides felis wCfeJ TaxID=2732594 RepID=UPI001FE2E419|nr:DUF1016 N-terminal domain-containing protein [Wolbachia endosymbiont of Ctenocephalides felis wCfeJ]
MKQLKDCIATSRYKTALAVNNKLIFLYHYIGTEILKRKKEHGWDAKIIDQLSKDLRDTFPDMKGFSTRNLKYMRKFAELTLNLCNRLLHNCLGTTMLLF